MCCGEDSRDSLPVGLEKYVWIKPLVPCGRLAEEAIIKKVNHYNYFCMKVLR